MLATWTAAFPLAQQAPIMDGTYWLLLLSRVLHILGAMTIVGGLIYLRLVVEPNRSTAEGAASDSYFGGRRGTWAMLVGIATAFLLASGLFNYVNAVKTYEMATSYHMLFGIKFLLGMAVFALAALIAGRTALADQLRQNIRYWLNVCLALSLAIIILGAMMRTYPRVPKGSLPPLPPPDAAKI